jgi:hypothetical protein
MLNKKKPSMIGIVPKGLGKWPNNNDDNDIFNQKMVPLNCFTQYFDRAHPTNCSQYNLGNDYYGGQFWAPSNCLKTFSWNIPKQASPYIAVIGDQTALGQSF